MGVELIFIQMEFRGNLNKLLVLKVLEARDRHYVAFVYKLIFRFKIVRNYTVKNVINFRL